MEALSFYLKSFVSPPYINITKMVWNLTYNKEEIHF